MSATSLSSITEAGRTAEGFYQVKNGIEPCIARAIAYAPYCDLIWMETSKPDLAQARRFAEAVHKAHPASCSPITARRRSTGKEPRRRDDCQVPARAGRDGLQVPVHHAGWLHQLNYGMFELARGYKDRQMAAYSELQQAEFAAEADGYTATKHQREVGTAISMPCRSQSPAASLRPPP
ncbi:hypothetical protein VXQ18_06560 [Brucella abortus]|nr:hypothetical protein [Brucella abortus]